MRLDEKYQLYILDGLNCNRLTAHGRLFMDLLAVRISGYHKFYGNKLMPIDMYDHFSKHIVLCKKGGDDENLIFACVRSISHSSCIKNKLEFLPTTRVSNHSQSLAKKIEELIVCDANLSYDTGLTINPMIEASSESYLMLRLIIGITLNYHRYCNEKMFLVSGIKKTKTDRLFSKIGFIPVCEDANYILKGMEDDDFVLMKYFRDNKYSLDLIKDTMSLWENRIEFSSNNEVEKYSVIA